MENRNGLIVAAIAMRASGHAERLAALALSEPDASQPQPISFGADKGYDAREFVMELLEKAVTPHVAKNTSDRRSAIGGRITRHFRLCCLPAHSQTRGRASTTARPEPWLGSATTFLDVLLVVARYVVASVLTRGLI
jgi:hypothetical protein